MRYIWVIILICLFGCNSQSPGALNPEQQIQRQLEKHDIWLEDNFHAQIHFFDTEGFKQKYKKACIAPSGKYFYAWDHLYIHRSDSDRWADGLGILDHEIVHVLFDYWGEQRGAFPRQVVQGPTSREMHDYMIERLLDEGFDVARADIKKNFPRRCHKKWFAYMNDPPEVIARMVDSLYSVYFGPYHFRHFPLTQKDLTFLARYEYQGKPMFQKGIERYQVGLQMLEDGFTPEEIQQQLEFATKFKYRDKTYQWPKIEIDLTDTVKL